MFSQLGKNTSKKKKKKWIADTKVLNEYVVRLERIKSEINFLESIYM